jgi:hypothetical protein
MDSSLTTRSRLASPPPVGSSASSSSKWPPVCHGGELRGPVGAWGERRCLANTETKPARCHTPATKSTTLVLQRGSGRRRVWSACRAHALVLRRGEGGEACRRGKEGRRSAPAAESRREGERRDRRRNSGCEAGVHGVTSLQPAVLLEKNNLFLIRVSRVWGACASGGPKRVWVGG